MHFYYKKFFSRPFSQTNNLCFQGIGGPSAPAIIMPAAAIDMTQEIVAGIVATASNESQAATFTKDTITTATSTRGPTVNGAGGAAGLVFKSLYLNSAQNGLNPADDDLDQYFGQSKKVEFTMNPDDYPQMIKDAELLFGTVVDLGEDGRPFQIPDSNVDQPWNPLEVKTHATPEKPNHYVPCVKILDEDEMNQLRLEENVDIEILDLTNTGRNAVIWEMFQQI